MLSVLSIDPQHRVVLIEMPSGNCVAIQYDRMEDGDDCVTVTGVSDRGEGGLDVLLLDPDLPKDPESDELQGHRIRARHYQPSERGECEPREE